ncbi:MAG: ArnT family glycosyltransferase, partial [Janthinobacterium lividum]
MRGLARSRPFAAALLLAFCLAWFWSLGARTLVPTDEGRYAEMAREMVTTNDWITPHLNGIKYFEKPPLQNWMNALTFKAFGFGDWQARLWTGVCGFFGIWMVYYTGRRVFGRAVGITAAAVLGSSVYWIAMGHINSLDMGLAATMTLALCGLLLGQRNEASPRQRRKGMLLCWAGMALAVLSKGLIGVVLPGAVLVLYMLLARDWTVWKRLYFGPGLLLFMLLCAPWFILVSAANPSFAHFFFIHEHLQRFTSTVHHRTGSWHYFFPILFAGILPWLGILVQSLWDARKSDAGGFQPKLLLVV